MKTLITVLCLLLVALGVGIFQATRVDAYADGAAAHSKGNYETAIRLLRSAAEQGHPEAQYLLGSMYYNGQGVARDLNETFKWWQKAAQQGDAPSQFNVGVFYEDGEIVARDTAAAFDWYQKAAVQGHAKAQYKLGVMYETGQVVAQDYDQAVRQYRLAAEQGHVAAQYNLGVMYQDGLGVTQDYAEAVKRYVSAASRGYADAQYNLGVMRYRGVGLPQDYVQSYAWFDLAASNGSANGTKNREAVAGLMSPEQIAQGRMLSRRWQQDSAITQIAQKISLPDRFLSQWKDAQRGEPLFPDSDESESVEVMQLKRELARLTLERNMLRDVAAFFAKKVEPN